MTMVDDDNVEPDLLGDHVEAGVRFLHMADEDMDAWAAEIGKDRAYVDDLWARMATAWTELDPDVLSDDQYRRLFDRDPPSEEAPDAPPV
jgi:hypothetical protein